MGRAFTTTVCAHLARYARKVNLAHRRIMLATNPSVIATLVWIWPPWRAEATSDPVRRDEA